MGMYTEFFFRAMVKKDLPEGVTRVLEYFGRVTDDPPADDQLPDHPLFKCYRWSMLGHGSGILFNSSSAFTNPDWRGFRGLSMWCEFKNYDSEIEKFIDWIGPYLAGSYPEFVGFSLYEEDDAPCIYMSPEGVTA